MTTKSIGTAVGLFTVLTVLTSNPAAALPRMAVDCNAGEDLQAVVEAAEAEGGARITISGDCQRVSLRANTVVELSYLVPLACRLARRRVDDAAHSRGEN